MIGTGLTVTNRNNGQSSVWAMLPIVFAVVAFVVSMSPATASAQDVQSLLDRIERLERDLRTLNIQLARGQSVSATVAVGKGAGDQAGQPMNPAGIAHLDSRITALEGDLRAVTGSVEELGFHISQLTTRLDKLIGDVDYRLSELERGRVGAGSAAVGVQGDGLLPQDQSATPLPVTPEVDTGTGVLGSITAEQLQSADVSVPSEVDAATEGSGTGISRADTGTLSSQELSAPQPTATDGNEQVAALTPQDEYAQAFALLRQAKYDEAAAALQSFVDSHGDHDLASNARYWLGETYYVRSEYVRAAEVFFEAYRLAPKGPKAPDTLLKLGMALGNLGKKPEACAAFAKLEQEFPNPSPAIVSKLDRERSRNGCEAG
ncbi:MAG: tol-pal system protein YbgF [Rhodospirillales bacterium]